MPPPQPLSARPVSSDCPPLSDESLGSLTARLDILRHTLGEDQADVAVVQELTAADRTSFHAVLNHPAFTILPPFRHRQLPPPNPPLNPLTGRSYRSALSLDHRVTGPPSHDGPANQPRSLRRARDHPLLARVEGDAVAFLRNEIESLSRTAVELPIVSAHLRILRAQLRNEGDVALVGETEQRVSQMTTYLNGWADNLRDLQTQLRAELAESAADAELADQRRQSKRRKLAHDGRLPNNAPIKYGWNGQVEPGDLKLEIVSCDGEDYGPPHYTGFRAENVLLNDYSVYCSKSAVCDILFRHQGETIFHLDTFVVKAPECGFSAPIQQGLIFVGMNKEELVSGSAAYHMRYDRSATSTPSSGLPSDADDPRLAQERLTFLESLNDHHTWLAVQTQRLQDNPAYPGHEEYLTYVDVGPADDVDDVDSVYGQDCDPPIPDDQATSQSGLTAAPTPPPFGFTITAEDSEEVPDEEEPILDRLRRMQQQMRRSSQARGEDIIPPIYLNRRSEIHPERRSLPSRIFESHLDDRVEALKPIASFFISQTKSKITLKFEPSVSGRYVLLKLFSPQDEGGTIDVQHVAAMGYSGPRIFPAVDLA